MTEQVRTDGFVVQNTAPAVQPQDATPGFVVPPLAAPALPAVPAATVAPVAPAADAGMAAAIAALTAAITPAPTAAPVADSLNTLDTSTIDDPTLRSMATAFKQLGNGMDFDRVFAKALDSGDASLLDMAYLREKAGANADSLAGLAESIVRVVNQRATAAQTAVHNIAGGEANWNASTAAFNKAAPPEFKLAISQMLDSGKEAQVQAAAKLVVQFAKGQGYVPTPAELLNAGAGANAGQALDKAGFQAELQKLNPSARDYAVQRGQLFARRQIGKSLGM